MCGRAHMPGRLFGPARLSHAAAGRKTPERDRNRALDFERNRIAVVMIRLARFGARKQPYYRIVVIEKDRARNGRSIEVVGTYNPRTSPATVELKHERIAYWRGVGAQVLAHRGKAGDQEPGAGRRRQNRPQPEFCSSPSDRLPCAQASGGQRTQFADGGRVCAVYYSRTDSSVANFWTHPVRGKSMTQHDMVAS